ncbi:hypothetical protein [Magnetospirillum moscoviense]|uniref:Uncharacterized protein n=1 Tax=Magnetospirillum moscoviense TaxID=1437059 RepID=A0A178MRG3_9PROT|nr:hypothetical protein [Magnetospirillum moscoviense]OAN50698.1 hypothetical protein A6A05_11880 [Magnetospirillum moscoviense]
MFVSEASIRSATDLAAARPLVGPVLDYDASLARALDDQRYRLNSNSESRSRRDLYDDYADEVFQATGQRLENPWRVSDQHHNYAQSADDVRRNLAWRQAQVDAFHARIEELAPAHPQVPVKSAADMQQQVFARARQVKDDAARPGTEVGWSGLGSFLGSAQGVMEDPLQWAMLVFGGGAGAGVKAAAQATLAERLALAGSAVAGTAGREAVVGAAGEALVQTRVADFNQRAGIDYGLGDAAEQVAWAAGGGAVLGGGLHAVGLGMSGLLDRWQAAKAAGQVVEDGETRAAENVLKGVAAARAGNPFPAGVEGDVAFSDASDTVFRALRSGDPIPAEVEARFRAHRIDTLGDLTARALADPKAGDVVVYGVMPPHQVRAAFQDWPDSNDFRTHPVRRLTSDTVRHIVNGHGQDQIPFRLEHVSLIPDVVEGGELVSSGIGKGGHEIKWRRLIDGNWLTVVEIAKSDKRPMFGVVTAYWNKGPKDGGGGPKGAPPRDARFTGSMAESPETHGTDGNPRPAGDSPVTTNMRAARNERKSLPPELAPPSSRPPETLSAFLRRKGGLRDDDGWLAHLGIDNKLRPGLISAKGQHLDDAALRAWEDGFFPEYAERPSPDQLRRAIADDLDIEGADRVRGTDLNARLEWDAYHSGLAELDRMGVDPYGKSWAEIQAEVGAFHTREAADANAWRQALAFIDPAAAKALDDETAFIARISGDLLADDVMVPSSLVDDGAQILRSAREALDEADDDALTWGSAITCWGKM